MLRELVVDRRVARAAVGEQVVRLGVDRRRCAERVGALEVREELVPEPDALGGALEQPGDVGDGELEPSSSSTVPSCGASVVNG